MTLLKTHKEFFFLWGWCFLCFILEISPYVEVKKIAFCIKFSIKNKLPYNSEHYNKIQAVRYRLCKSLFQKDLGPNLFICQFQVNYSVS